MKSKTKKKGSFYVRRRKEVFGNCRFKERIRKRTDASGSTPRHEFFRCTKTSGLAGIAYWINQNYRLTGEQQIDKHDPLVLALKGWVDAEYEDGRQTVMSAKELNAKIAELAPGRFAQV